MSTTEPFTLDDWNDILTRINELDCVDPKLTLATADHLFLADDITDAQDALKQACSSNVFTDVNSNSLTLQQYIDELNDAIEIGCCTLCGLTARFFNPDTGFVDLGTMKVDQVGNHVASIDWMATPANTFWVFDGGQVGGTVSDGFCTEFTGLPDIDHGGSDYGTALEVFTALAALNGWLIDGDTEITES